MDYTKYIEKKAKGLAEVVTAGGGYAFAFKKFDPETGEQALPEIQAVGLDELNTAKTNLQNQITDIEAVIADIQALS